MRQQILAAVLLGLPSVLAGQAPTPVAGGFMMRPDDAKANASAVKFVAMSKGWHATMGPVHAIFYRPTMTAKGTFTATFDAYFFGPPGRFPEGYGILIGGQDLAGANQSYVYFLARDDGKFLIKKRQGDATPTIMDWTASPAIRTVKAGDSSSVENVFTVHATKDSVIFSINGTRVAARPRSEIAADGVVGFRINHGLSIHVAGISVEPK